VSIKLSYTRRQALPWGPHPHKGGLPSNLTFLALAQHKAGKKAESEATLKRLRAVMKQPDWATHPEAQRFLGEAESLLKLPP
jgi:hypothetical protein